jgi:hypothetical protein
VGQTFVVAAERATDEPGGHGMTMAATQSRQRSNCARSNNLQLNLLDGFSVIACGEAWDVPDSCQRLLVYLALHERP